MQVPFHHLAGGSPLTLGREAIRVWGAFQSLPMPITRVCINTQDVAARLFDVGLLGKCRMSDSGFRLSDVGLRDGSKTQTPAHSRSDASPLVAPEITFKGDLSPSSLSPSGPFSNISIFTHYAHRFGQRQTDRACLPTSSIYANDGLVLPPCNRDVAIAVRSQEHVMAGKSPPHVSGWPAPNGRKKTENASHPGSLTRLGSC